MKISEMFGGFLKAAQDAGIPIEPDAALAAQAAPTAPTTAPQQPQQSASDDGAAKIAAENAELRKQLAKARAERIQADAQAFVKEQLGQGHIYPAESAALAALYVRAAEIDAREARDDGQPSCVALVQAAYAQRPAHQLGHSLLAPQMGAGVVLTNGGGEDAELAQVESAARKYAERANGRSR